MPAFQDPEVYRDILNGLQIGVSVLDLQKKIVFWSDGAEQITGYARFEVLGHTCSDNILQHCNQLSCEMCDEKCPITAALHESRAIEAAGFVHHKSGHRTPVHTWSIPLRAKNGSIIGVIQTFDGQFGAVESDPKEHNLKQRGWLDEVTGLPNPAIMHSHLRETLGTFTEMHIPFCIILLDFPELDQFRARYGQGASRAMVQVLARTMRNTIWATDFVGRWNESQFLIILMGCDEDALHAVSRRMLRMMAGATIMWWGEELSLRPTLGRAAAQNGDNLETLLQRSQQSLQQFRGEISKAAASPGAD
jgi:diguanylate cyclase (GGDEF)-like protein/PAS domain S-box-containing protein